MIERVSIPEGLTWNCPSRQRVVRMNDAVSYGSDLPDRLRYSLACGRRAVHTEFMIELSGLSMLESLYHLRRRLPNIRIVVSDDQMGEIHRNRARISALSPTLVLDRCEGSLPRTVQFMASLNVPIEVTPSVFMAVDEKSLNDLGERLLFSPFVKIPVHPFFGMLQSAMDAGTSSASFTLRDICTENPGRHYYITTDGKITLSKRWADRNRFFGTFSDTIDEIHASDFYRELTARKEAGATASPECSACPVLRFCSGYLRAPDAAYDCSPIVSLYEFMRSHVSSLKENYTSLTIQKKRDVLQAMVRPVHRAQGRCRGRNIQGPGRTDVLMSRKTKSKQPGNEQ